MLVTVEEVALPN